MAPFLPRPSSASSRRTAQGEGGQGERVGRARDVWVGCVCKDSALGAQESGLGAQELEREW
eukprot:7122824-Alexandrium_andersonii.AAC.1